MSRHLPIRGAVRGALLALVAGIAAAGGQASDELSAVVAEYRSGRPGAVDRAGALLRALQPDSAGSIFELEVGRVELEGGVPFDGELREFVLGALAGWPAARVGEEIVARLGESPTYGEAFVALDLLGRAGDEDAVVALLGGLDADAMWLRHDRFHEAVERALRGCSSRGAGGGRRIGAWVRGAPVHLLPGAARFLAGGAGVAGVRATSLVLDRDPGLDLELLRALGARDPRGDRAVEDARVDLLRRVLWSDSLPRRRQAIASLAALHDTGLAPELIAWLDGDDASLRACARDALCRLAGADVGGANPEGWRRWVEEERVWLEEELPALARTLREGDAGPAVRALRDARGHPYLRRKLEAALLPHIRHPEPSVAGAVCRTLGALDCRGAIGPLEEFVRVSGRGRVLGEARKALAALTE